MAIESMCKELIQQIHHIGGTDAQVEAYIEKLRSATQNNSEPFPCPVCFLKNEVQRLQPLKDTEDGTNEYGKVKCSSCKEIFQFKIPSL